VKGLVVGLGRYSIQMKIIVRDRLMALICFNRNILYGKPVVLKITSDHAPQEPVFCSYMISWSSQIWFLSLLKCFFQLSAFSVFVTG